ncbi:MAG: SLC26A/SulP transporter family protein [Candidatus Promineifilaceae bacterium]
MEGTRKGTYLARLAAEFQPHQLLPSLMAGLLTGLLEVLLAVSFAALIFSDGLSNHVANGVGLALFGAMIAGAIVALASSLPGTVSGSQDVPAAILAVIAAAIAAGMPAEAGREEIFVTVVAAIALTTILTGIFLLGLGAFRLGGLVRFLPYPVMGGFLAGTGWLLVTGALSLMADLPADLPGLPDLFQAEVLSQWLPGVVFALVLVVAMERYDHYLIMPGLILAAILLFFAALWLSGTSVSEASAGGWLLGPFPEQSLWRPLTPADLSQVNWQLLWGQAANIGTVALVSGVALLLNASGLELAVNRDVELNRELSAAGAGNLVAGLVAGLTNYHLLSGSVMNHKLHAGTRLAGLIGAALCGLALLLGASVLGFFPKAVVGGLLLFLGLTFLIEWVIKSWSTLPRADYVIVLAILVAVVALGFLQGVALGIAIAVVLFVVGYSRVDVVRHALSGATYRSRVTHDPHQQRLLDDAAEEIFILQLQGFIFFGTANSLLERVRQRIHRPEGPAVRFVLLDFRAVTGLDSTAALSFARMGQHTQLHNIHLLFTGLSPKLWRQLEGGGLDEEGELFHRLADLDRGVEWCERQILAAAGAGTSEPRDLRQQLEEILGGPADIGGLLEHLERQEVGAGYVLMRQGDAPDVLYFIESGQVTAQMEGPAGQTVRLQTMQGGHVVGEIGFYLGQQRTATVIADGPSVIYCLTREALAQMERQEPQAASTLHRVVVHLSAQRIAHLVRTVAALQR